MNRTGIEYLDFTWSPIAMRCTPCSPGCTNCWHIRTADRMSHNHCSFPLQIREAYAGRGGPVLVDERLNDPLKRKKPARIGIQFMGDLWHKDVHWPKIDEIFLKCHQAEHHTYLFLTKRIKAALYYFNSPIYSKPTMRRTEFLKHENIHFGVTVCNQPEADEKIPILLQIPAAVRWVSIEPILGPIKFSHHWLGVCEKGGPCGDHGFLSWVVCAGETGPGARLMHPDWARSLRDQCVSAGVPFFFKQWGEWTSEEGWYLKEKFGASYKSIIVEKDKTDKIGISMGRVGKKKAGRLLDGKEWDQYPEIL